jgi:tetratricopeptide (TPR) repeat protein
MPSETLAFSTQPPAIAYARLLVEMHRLIGEGKGDAEETEALAERMDAPWYAMTAQEQARMRGLAADLNALREGGPRRTGMSPEQLATWQQAAREAWARAEAGDEDTALSFLRQPVPSGLPGHAIPFLQARCWDRLGDLETALVFMKEADRQDPDHALSVLVLLQRLGRVDELREYARRIIANPASSPLDLYLAAVALLFPTRWMSDTDAEPILREVRDVLTRTLSAYLALPPEKREEFPQTDASIAQALGLVLERLKDRKSALDVYSAAIARHPRDGELLVARGLALYEKDVSQSLSDFMKAVRLGVAAIWPYFILARHVLQNGAAGEALRLALAAERQPGPAAARAEVYEIIAIALGELGQPQERVLENFDRALALDPKNDRIRKNREIAAALIPAARSGRAPRRLMQAPPFRPEDLRRASSDQIRSRSELLADQLGNRVGGELVAV